MVRRNAWRPHDLNGSTERDEQVPAFRRIVTGHDQQGNSIISGDAPPSRTARIGGQRGPMFYEVCNTRETPARIDCDSGEPVEDKITLAPPKGGTRIRVLDVPP